MEQFIMKTKVYMGKSALEHLKEFQIRRALIICDPFMVESGAVKLVTDCLDAWGSVYEIFSDVIPDPDIQTVIKGITRMADFEPDTLIALGGGSAIDTAKGVRYIYEKSDQGHRKQLIAIPTTSGTGSEVTSFAVITDREKDVKYPLRDDAMMPDGALLDPELVVTVPAAVTADTGMDVLTHALEACASVKACDFGDAFAEKAMKLVFEYLEKAVKNGADRFARERIHNASCMAGVAFNSTSLGLCHGMAHALGAKFHLSHGRSNGLLLAHIIAYNGETEGERYKKAAQALGISSPTGQIGALNLSRKVNRLRERIGIPEKVTELGISKKEFLEAIPEMARTALEDPCTETNPRKPSQEDIEGIYAKLV